MKKLKLDTGLVSYQIGQGVLRFHPGDPNVYMRFQQAVEKLAELENTFHRQLEDMSMLEALTQADRELKQTLNWVFGPGNDFDQICGGVNLLAADGGGQRLIEKLLSALEPVLLEGARQCAGANAQ